MIHVDNVTRRYGSLTAVDCVSFDVETNEIIGFLGPNGAGKSTSLRMCGAGHSSPMSVQPTSVARKP